jgi:uncharacterized peroxidase-related enzyme
MSWIRIIPYESAAGRLRKLYDRVKGPDNNVDNIMLAHSLRPHTMEGHMALYKYALHHTNNTVPKWFLETIGVFTSMLNTCPYCIEHHFAGLARLLQDDARSGAIRKALASRTLADTFDTREQSALGYVQKLTLTPGDVSENDVRAMREAGWDDGEILEINQVTAYFCYANRTVLGLGVNTDGDILGLSPGTADADDWQHG